MSDQPQLPLDLDDDRPVEPLEHGTDLPYRYATTADACGRRSILVAEVHPLAQPGSEPRLVDLVRRYREHR